MEDNKLLEIASKDQVFNEYDKAAIKKELWLTKAFIVKELAVSTLSQMISLISILGIFFLPLNEIQSLSIAGIASPSAALLINKNGQLEKQLNKKK